MEGSCPLSWLWGRTRGQEGALWTAAPPPPPLLGVWVLSRCQEGAKVHPDPGDWALSLGPDDPYFLLALGSCPAAQNRWADRLSPWSLAFVTSAVRGEGSPGLWGIPPWCPEVLSLLRTGAMPGGQGRRVHWPIPWFLGSVPVPGGDKGSPALLGLFFPRQGRFLASSWCWGPRDQKGPSRGRSTPPAPFSAPAPAPAPLPFACVLSLSGGDAHWSLSVPGCRPRD